MSDTPTPSTPAPRPYGLGGIEAVALASLVLNLVTVGILIVALVGRHAPGGAFECHRGHGGPGEPGGMMMPGHPGFAPGGEEHGGMGPRRFDGPFDPAQFTDRVLEHLTTRFALTDAQRAQLKPILEQQAQDFSKERDARRQAREQAFEAVRAKIRAVLTPDQQKQFDQEKAEREHGPQRP